MRFLVAVALVLVGGCGSQGNQLALQMNSPMAIDWRVGVNGIDGYSGLEVQGDTTSEWFFVASNDQGDQAPQTFKILVPMTDGVVQLKPWWLGVKDNAAGINCNSWNGSANVQRDNGTVVS